MAFCCKKVECKIFSYPEEQKDKTGHTKKNLEGRKTAFRQEDPDFNESLAGGTMFYLDAKKVAQISCTLGKTRRLLEWIFADISHPDLGEQACLK